jgi:phosphatidate cytidylyltransferase
MVGALASVLAAGFAVIAGICISRRQRLTESSLFIRWRTWVFIAPVAVLAILSGLVPLTLLVMLICWVGIWEYAGVVGLGTAEKCTLGAIAAEFALLALVAPTGLIPGVVLSVIGLAVVSLAQFEETAAAKPEGAPYNGFTRMALAMLAMLYLPLLGTHAIIICRMPGGDGLLLSIVVASAISNVAAFTVGKLLGKHKLSPAISPNKTLEGAAGSLFGAGAGFALMRFAQPNLPLPIWLGIPAIIAVAGIGGDLFESLMKRSFGVKDAAGWLPGFGGVLDRIDGLLFVMPCVFYYLVWAGLH